MTNHLENAMDELQKAIDELKNKSEEYYSNNDNRRGNLCYDAMTDLKLRLNGLYSIKWPNLN